MFESAAPNNPLPNESEEKWDLEIERTSSDVRVINMGAACAPIFFSILMPIPRSTDNPSIILKLRSPVHLMFQRGPKQLESLKSLVC